MDCTASDDSGVLEIGERYLFASKKNRGFLSRRSALELQIRIIRRSSASEKTAEILNLSKDKIGELTFCPRLKADGVTAAIQASLDTTLFLDDELFENLMETLHLGKKPEWLQLDIEKVGTLAHGWEPDGSRKEWKIANPSEPSSVDITKIALGIKLF